MRRLACLLLLPWLAGCGLCLPSPEALGVLRELAPHQAAASPEASRTAIQYDQAGKHYQADLYQPLKGAPRAGLVLVPGAAMGGKDDPRLVALANVLAREQFAVLVPDIPTLRALRVSPTDVRVVADAFAYMLTRPDLAPDGRAGLAGISYAAGPAFMAALEPALRDRVRFILSVGGYHDINEVITFFTTGYFRENGPWRYMPPLAYGKWVFVMSNADYLSNPADRAALKSLAEKKLANPDAAIAEPTLTPEGQTVWALLTNTDPERVPALLARLPESIRAPLAELNLADKDLSAIHARVILIHGRDDDLIPYTQSVALAKALPPDRVRLTLVDGMYHVDIKGLRFLDVWRLSCAIKALLAERGP